MVVVVVVGVFSFLVFVGWEVVVVGVVKLDVVYIGIWWVEGGKDYMGFLLFGFFVWFGFVGEFCCRY